MTGWIEVLTIAFTAQLLALPGEKGQFVIAGLATKYRPAVVVAGAACAFAGWTMLEIALGSALQGATGDVSGRRDGAAVRRVRGDVAVLAPGE